ncbi:MAG: NADAR family protein [Christensenellales bacterium]
MKYNKQSIIQRYRQGEELNLLFFWGHDKDTWRVGKTCLSQWYAVDFEVDGVKYHTAEQWMMAQKAILMDDLATYGEIMKADNPRDCKSLGRKVKGFDDKLWDSKKYDIICQGNYAKFSQNPQLKEFLISTGDAILVEASPYDSIWGVKMSADDPQINNPQNWQGENLLGFALMEVRDALSQGQ